jgi:hypothetical protein
MASSTRASPSALIFSKSSSGVWYSLWTPVKKNSTGTSRA